MFILINGKTLSGYDLKNFFLSLHAFPISSLDDDIGDLHQSFKQVLSEKPYPNSQDSSQKILDKLVTFDIKYLILFSTRSHFPITPATDVKLDESYDDKLDYSFFEFINKNDEIGKTYQEIFHRPGGMHRIRYLINHLAETENMTYDELPDVLRGYVDRLMGFYFEPPGSNYLVFYFHPNILITSPYILELKENLYYTEKIINAFYSLYAGNEYQAPETLLLNIAKNRRLPKLKELEEAINKNDVAKLEELKEQLIEKFYVDYNIDEDLQDIIKLKRI